MESRSSRQPSLFRRLFLTLSIVSATVALAVLVTATFMFQRAALADARALLEEECTVLASAVDAGVGSGAAPAAELARIEWGSTRVTLVAGDGDVLYDSAVDGASLENHADRPEIRAALDEGAGSSERPSETVGQVSLYEARRLSDGSVLRISVDRAGVVSVLLDEVWMLAAVVAALVAASWVVARILARRLMRPILSLDPAHPDSSATYDEVVPLVEKISSQQQDLAAQLEEIKGADAMRREFTSNVTHELKTPLASISCAAELIHEGIVRPEDVADFGGRILGDARRLSMLVNDILTLSKLDESERSNDRSLLGAPETVDLRSLAIDVCERVRTSAERRGISLCVDGEPTFVQGIPRLLDEMVGNLVGNAVRYNRDGGSVTVEVRTVGGAPRLVVRDTGIGIAPEHQAKVFERFYRVDPARARETGGTGLGLAIVKHAVVYHRATIDLKSELGQGTEITVTFPAGDR